MIKINLLPRSIYERRAVKKLAILFGVLVLAVVVIGVLYTQMFLVRQVEAMQAKADEAERLRIEVEGIESQTAKIKQDTDPINRKIQFITQVLDYNQKFPKLYEDIAKWTYEKIAYTSMSCDGFTVKMSARARSLDDLGRYLLNMYQARELFSQVTISGVPGYPIGSGEGGTVVQNLGLGSWGGGGPQGSLEGIGAIAAGVQQGPRAQYINFEVTCTLRTPIVAPSFGGAQPGAPGVPGTPGAPGVPAAPGVPPMPGAQPPAAPPTPDMQPDSAMPPGGGPQGPP